MQENHDEYKTIKDEHVKSRMACSAKKMIEMIEMIEMIDRGTR